MKNKAFLFQFAIIAALLMCVLIQSFTHVVPMKPLNGFTNELAKKKLTFQSYYHGSYQDYLTQYAKENTGFRELFIRNYNQIAYSCFNKITNNNVVKGKNDELFLKMYLDDITGKRLQLFYPSVEEAKADAQRNVETTLALIDTLKQHGTTFLFVFAPSKTGVFPELMPHSYQAQISDFSLEEYYIELFKENNIPHIDFLNYFRSLKDTFPYPLYTKMGTHWSAATIPMVVDSVMRKLEALSGFDLPEIQYIDDNPTTDYTLQDEELEGQMNLLFPLPRPALPRPVFALGDTVGKDRPNLLGVGDSYFFQLRNSCFVDAFNHWDYWVYNREIQASRPYYHGKQLKWVFDAAQVIEDADIVLAVFTAPFMYTFMCGFAQQALDHLQHGNLTHEESIQATIAIIKETPEWYQSIEQQAADKGISTEENLRSNAEYVLEQQRLEREQYQ